MKKLVMTLLLGVSINLFGQEINDHGIKETYKYSEDSKLVVIYTDSLTTHHNGKSPVYFINGTQFINETVLKSLNPKKIESIDVKKENLELDGKEYYGIINIKIKENYQPNFITLKELTDKYLILDSEPTVYQIDDNIINSKAHRYIVDEQFILKIEVSKVKTTDQKTEINFVKIYTKTSDNIKKANEIRIKGIKI